MELPVKEEQEEDKEEQEEKQEEQEEEEEQEQDEVQKKHEKKQNDQVEQKIETDEIIPGANQDIKDTHKRKDTIEVVHDLKTKNVCEESTLITRKRGRPKKTTSDINVFAKAAIKLRKTSVKVVKVKEILATKKI